MARYFFGNTLASFFRSSTDVVEDTSNPGVKFDSRYVSNAIYIPSIYDFIQTMPFVDASPVTDIRIHFDIYTDAGQASNWIEFYDNSNTLVAQIYCPNGTPRFQYWNGSAMVTYLTATAVLPVLALTTVDMHVVCGASGSCDMWFNGTRVMTASGGMNAAFDNIAYIRFRSPGVDSTTRYSQILAADYDLRDDKYVCLMANGNGTYTDGSGTYTDINETVLDESTAILLPAHGNKHTFIYAPPNITVPDGYGTVALCVAARARVSGGTITDGELILKSGASFSTSSGRSYNSGYEPRGYYAANDPATLNPWTQAGINAAEFGIEAP
jgi:hypothetical protein